MKWAFRNQLLSDLPKPTPGRPMKSREFLEEKLLGCVLANLPSFTELLAEPFIFTNMVPVSRHSINLPASTNTLCSLLRVCVQCFI
jgi:hypothetical protein